MAPLSDDDTTIERVLKRVLDTQQKEQREWSGQQFGELKGCVRVVQTRVETLEKQFDRVEGGLNTAVDQCHKLVASVSTLEERVSTNSERLQAGKEEFNDLHGAINAVAEEQGGMRQLCVAHNGELKSVAREAEVVGTALSKQELALTTLTDQFSGLAGDTQVFRMQVKQAWKTVAVLTGALVAAVGLTLGVLKALGALN
jgi:chromosome segregation ATPase